MLTTYKFNKTASLDASIINKFLPEHLESTKKLINLNAHPNLYDSKNFKTIEFDDFQIIDANKIQLDTKQLETTSVTTQRARRGGGVNDKEEQDLDNSLTTRGVILSVPPGAVYKRSEDSYIYITGMTRDGRYKKYNFSNRLVAVYKRKEGYTDNDVQNELSQLGNIFNPKELPQVEAKEYDIIDEGVRAINQKWIKKDYQSIFDRIKPQCEAVGIGETRCSKIAMNVLNTASDKPVLPMTAEKAKIWLEDSKYKNIENKVKYITISYDFVSKGQVDAVKLAKKHPEEEIRVIVHCGIVTGGIEQYTERLTKFWVVWNAQLDAYSSVYFGGKTAKPKNLILYGGVPQVTEEMDTTQVCLFNQDSVEGEFSQKLGNEENPKIWK